MKTTRGARHHWCAPALVLGLLLAAVAFLQVEADAADADGDPTAALQWSAARPDTVVGVDTSERVVALSFDDGPDPRWTPTVLDALDRVGAKATFFLTGEHVGEHPDLAREIERRGHEVANHTYDHPELPLLDADATRGQVERANAAFAAAGLRRPALFRPPRGRFNTANAAGVRQTGLVVAGWTPGLCIEKHTALPAPEAAARVLAGVRPGAILLGHDGGDVDRSATVAALPIVLDGLRQAGYRMVTVSGLLALAPRSR